jgi:hypothetical protein
MAKDSSSRRSRAPKSAPVQHLEAHHPSRRPFPHLEPRVPEELKERLEAQPEVRVLGVGLPVLRQAEEAVEGEGLLEELVSPQDPPGLGHQEEEDAVGEAEEVLVEGLGVLLQRLSRGPLEEARPRVLEEGLHRFPQALPGPLPLLHGHLVVALHRGLVGGGRLFGQAGAVQEPEDQGEVPEAVLLHEGLEVHLHVGLAADEGGLAQEAELPPVGHQAPEGLRGVQVVLEEAVGRAPAPPGLAQLLAPGHHVDGRGLAPLVGPVEDGVGLAARLGVAPVVQPVAQEGEEGPDPALPGNLPLPLGAQGAPQPLLEEPPKGLGLLVGQGHLLLEGAPGQAEVLGGLEGHRPLLQEGQELGAEEAPLEAEGRGLLPNLGFLRR